MKERVFLVKNPDGPGARWKPSEIRLGWLEAGGRELVLRESGKRRSLSVGLSGEGGGRSRELPLAPADFEALWPDSAGRRLRLQRRQGRIGPWRIRLDRFLDGLDGLELARLSAVDAPAGRASPMLDFLGPEVGYDPRFDWSALAGGSVDPASLRGAGDDDFGGAIGVVPYLRSPEGVKIVLCTSPRRDRWIFPKGQNKPELSLRDVALMEAAEEAGLIGEVTGDPILCTYAKGGNPVDLILFPMEVKSMLKTWQEADSRDRALFGLDELRGQAAMAGLRPGLEMIADMAVDRIRT